MLRILFLQANPSDAPRLRVNREFRKITHAILRSENRNNVMVQFGHALQMADSQVYLTSFEPDVVHFCGHGSYKGIYVEDDFEQAVRFDRHAVVKLFKLLKGKVKCVVLNCCSSAGAAEELAEIVGFGIGMKGEIFDKPAIRFAESFYLNLCRSGELESSFELAKNAISSSWTRPVLCSKDPALLPYAKFSVKARDVQLSAQFRMTESGPYYDYDHEGYPITLCVENLPAGTIAVHYKLHHPTLSEQNLRVTNRAANFAHKIWSYGDATVRIESEGAGSGTWLKEKLSTALLRQYENSTDPRILSAIGEIQTH